MSSLASPDCNSYDANILKEMNRPGVYCDVSEYMPTLQWFTKYQAYVNNPIISKSEDEVELNTYFFQPAISIEKKEYEAVSRVKRLDATSSILNMFQILSGRGSVYEYFSSRLQSILEDEQEMSLDDISFASLYEFSLFDDFKQVDFSLQVNEAGRACLQKTYKEGYIFIEFFDYNKIFYNILVNNKDIINTGTYNDFFKDFYANPIRC